VAGALYDSHMRRTGRHGALLWSLLVLGAWSDRYLRGAAPATDSRRIAEAAIP
jgi:hypothetical protein